MYYRRRWLRYDIWLTLLIAFGIGWCAGKAAELVLPGMYESYAQEHVIDGGAVGGKAGPDVFRAQSIDDILSHDAFTIVSHGIRYRNRGAGYYHRNYTYAVELPSGEVVAAQINMESVQYDGEYYSSDHTLPVGRVVWADLTDDKYFMEQISYGDPLSRTDFYVDMSGVGAAMNREDYFRHRVDAVQAIATLVFIPLIHSLGAKIGIFPYFITPRKKKGAEQKGEWD